MSLHLDVHVASSVGHVREGNEDAAIAGERLLAVADGMGGHAAGEVASAAVIETLAPLDEDSSGPDLVRALEDGVRSANTRLRAMVAENPALDGMGTTVTALLKTGSRLGLVHVGDSRAYLLRGGELVQLTHDHTFVQSLVDAGRISLDEAETHPQRSMLLRALDGRTDVDIDTSVFEGKVGDRFLLCTDGMSGVVSRDTLAEALAEGTPHEAADRLIERALRAGGPDNITVVVADLVESSPATRGVTVAGAAAEARSSATAQPAAVPAGAAAKAAALRPASAESEPAENPETAAVDRARRRVRRGSLALALLAVLLVAGGLLGGWAYVQRQYYVGEHDGKVAVFRGTNGSILGLSLSSLVVESDTPVEDLPTVDQRRLAEGITARSRSDAESISSRLTDSVKSREIGSVIPRDPSPPPEIVGTAAPTPPPAS